jgi:succinate-semialdehyde dehydrogenase/glutarate-semialdehyde dehydrogenase
VKPAPQTPFSALAMAELAARAGIPAGVFNVVTGDAVAIGGEFTGNDKVRKLSFTGSTPVGKLLMAQCAGTVKKVAARTRRQRAVPRARRRDLDAAVTGAIQSKYRNTGQTCVCANRFIVQSKVYDAFTQKLTEGRAQAPRGGWAQGRDRPGPLIDAKALAKVEITSRMRSRRARKSSPGGGVMRWRHVL